MEEKEVAKGVKRHPRSFTELVTDYGRKSVPRCAGCGNCCNDKPGGFYPSQLSLETVKEKASTYALRVSPDGVRYLSPANSKYDINWLPSFRRGTCLSLSNIGCAAEVKPLMCSTLVPGVVCYQPQVIKETMSAAWATEEGTALVDCFIAQNGWFVFSAEKLMKYIVENVSMLDFVDLTHVRSYNRRKFIRVLKLFVLRYGHSDDTLFKSSSFIMNFNRILSQGRLLPREKDADSALHYVAMSKALRKLSRNVRLALKIENLQQN